MRRFAPDHHHETGTHRYQVIAQKTKPCSLLRPSRQCRPKNLHWCDGYESGRYNYRVGDNATAFIDMQRT